MKRLYTRNFLAAAVVLALAACSDNTTEPVVDTGAQLTIAAPAITVYESDLVQLTASYRDAYGVVVPNAPVTWSVVDTLRAELSANGSLFALSAGTMRVKAQSGALSATYDLTIVRAPVLKVVVTAMTPTLSRGEVTVIGVKPEGPGNRFLTGRTIALTSDQPHIAMVDAAGRLRAVSPGTATIRATAEGVTGIAQVQVNSDNTVLSLASRDGVSVPMLIGADTVEVFGVKEYHEVYLESGSLTLSGTTRLRYTTQLRIREYNVIQVNGQRVLIPSLNFTEGDFGTVDYDSRGDMLLTSEWISPWHHKVIPVVNGMHMQYDIGGDESMQLFFRR